MHKTARVQLPDLRYVDMRVDFSIKTFNAVIQICKELSEYAGGDRARRPSFFSLSYDGHRLKRDVSVPYHRHQTPGRIVAEQTAGAVPSEAQHEGSAVQRPDATCVRHQFVRRQQSQPVRFHGQPGHVLVAVHMRPAETPVHADQFAGVRECRPSDIAEHYFVFLIRVIFYAAAAAAAAAAAKRHLEERIRQTGNERKRDVAGNAERFAGHVAGQQSAVAESRSTEQSVETQVAGGKGQDERSVSMTYFIRVTCPRRY